MTFTILFCLLTSSLIKVYDFTSYFYLAVEIVTFSSSIHWHLTYDQNFLRPDSFWNKNFTISHELFPSSKYLCKDLKFRQVCIVLAVFKLVSFSFVFFLFLPLAHVLVCHINFLLSPFLNESLISSWKFPKFLCS